MLTLNDGSTIRLMSGATGYVNEYQSLTFDPQHTDIQQLQFADGSSISWGDFLQRGLVQHGTPNSIVLGSNYSDIVLLVQMRSAAANDEASCMWGIAA